MAIFLKISKIRRYIKTSKNPRKFKIHRDKLSLFYKGYIAKRKGGGDPTLVVYTLSSFILGLVSLGGVVAPLNTKLFSLVKNK
jgi:hypothetical protein